MEREHVSDHWSFTWSSNPWGYLTKSIWIYKRNHRENCTKTNRKERKKTFTDHDFDRRCFFCFQFFNRNVKWKIYSNVDRKLLIISKKNYADKVTLTWNNRTTIFFPFVLIKYNLMPTSGLVFDRVVRREKKAKTLNTCCPWDEVSDR